MALDRPQFGYLCDFLYKRSAIVLTPEKEYLVESRLTPLARQKGFGTVDALITALRTQPPGGLHTAVVEAMTTHETTFFRDQHPFEMVRSTLIPALKKARASSRALNILCAACSSGQEPYSLAMMVVEAGVELSGWSVRIIGVDLSEAVLARARKARFTQSEVNRGLPAGLLAKYFDSVEGEWQLKSIVRDRVELRQMNLIEPWPALPSIDLLFMRNVLIYFDVATKKAILARARQAMAPDGYLLLGGAETTINIDDKFESKSVGASIVYRQVGAR
jgi:chemotaxis protein methyltransferase CheR